MTTSDAYVRFSPDGPAEVDASLRVSDRTYIYCHTYPDDPPILSVRDRQDRRVIWIPPGGWPPRWRPTSASWRPG